MDSVGSGCPSEEEIHVVLSPQSLSLFGEGISLVFSRWTALQMAVENSWGGRDSRHKSEELTSTILTWFSLSKGPLYIDDLENMLEENMLNLFNTETEDGSIEEVAEELMIMHEDFLKGNYGSIEKLRSGPAISSVSQSKQIGNHDSEDESPDDEVSEMIVDEPEMVVETPKLEQVADEEGWSTVTSKRNKGMKCR